MPLFFCVLLVVAGVALVGGGHACGRRAGVWLPFPVVWAVVALVLGRLELLFDGVAGGVAAFLLLAGCCSPRDLSSATPAVVLGLALGGLWLFSANSVVSAVECGAVAVVCLVGVFAGGVRVPRIVGRGWLWLFGSVVLLILGAGALVIAVPALAGWCGGAPSVVTAVVVGAVSGLDGARVARAKNAQACWRGALLTLGLGVLGLPRLGAVAPVTCEFTLPALLVLAGLGLLVGLARTRSTPR